MAPTISYALPAMQLVCNLIAPESSSFNITTPPGLVVTNCRPSGPQTPLKSLTIPDGYVSHPDLRTAYKISTDKGNWKGARARCAEKGAHFASIDSPAKFERLMNQTTVDILHVGIHRMYDDTEWVSFSTGSTVTTLPWASTDPSGNFDCVRTSREPFGLRNSPCHEVRQYVCEIPLPEIYNPQEYQTGATMMAN